MEFIFQELSRHCYSGIGGIGVDERKDVLSQRIRYGQLRVKIFVREPEEAVVVDVIPGGDRLSESSICGRW